jgi:hypothetical protein
MATFFYHLRRVNIRQFIPIPSESLRIAVLALFGSAEPR